MFAVITSVYVFFGLFNYLVYGAEHLEDPLITSDISKRHDCYCDRNSLYRYNSLYVWSWLPFSVAFVYIVNLLITYPLVLHPANMVIEASIFKGVPKSRKRTWMKNLLRTCLVAATVGVGISLRHTLDKLMSVVGSLTCAPIAFIFPSLFHYKLAATTKRERVIDLTIAGIGIFLMIFITIYTLITWNDS